MKRYLAILLSLTFLFTMTPSTLATSPEDPPISQKQEIEFQSNLEYTSLLNSFWEDYDGSYPDYYAGAYINSDGLLVVRICGLTDEVCRDVQHRTGNQSILLEEAETSYNTLLSLKNRVTEYVKNNPDTAVTSNLLSASVLDDSSTLEIGVKDDSEDSVAAVLSAVFPATRSFDLTSVLSFVVEERDPVKNDTTPVEAETSISPTAATNTVYAGDRIDTKSGYMSIGFPCRMETSSGSYVYGFVTSAHGCEKNESIYINGTAIGTVYEWKLDGRIDCAFVKMTNQNYSFPHKIKLYNEDTGKTSIYPVAIGTNVVVAVGSSVYKDGATTNTTSGTVKSVDSDLYFDDIKKTITNMIKTSPMTEPGDSGGLGFMIGTDSSTLKTAAVKFGIVEGNSHVLGISTASYFINYQYIYSDMPVYAYQESYAPW
ncbi:hypothetical protein [Pseudoflavonifractor phocaeensis]|uniref:hypothetical protein n=1 Tax=Pseudoflavonifractor phocaeensis TaxID=1870988 RepID=UPI0019565AE8|nr:hypothetical protein [Pseudoflavonifractor phocaeensis]MBM6725398.1 hypothetical protein [Pseudoflavonifractor phocaeensis]